MKCKVCGGTGTSNTCVNGTFKPCTFCDGTGEYEPFDADVELDKLYPTEPTNEEWLRSATFEELAGAIYEWYSLGYTRGKNGKKLNSITEVVEWLKEKHDGNVL